ncbi:hypothetical protein [Reichenbachiella sp. MALMAid0571]|uniref:hypothetical protein n=1 Tax=Reichenbachiella sp. MALMAid0571 TaxID=3143939 RepID=UPI0032DEE102
MKNYTLSLFLVLVCLHASGQEKETPRVSLNSNEINLSKTYINPVNIDSIRVDKVGKMRGMHLYSNDLVFLSLEEVLETHTEISMSDSLLFRINGKVVGEIENLRIDQSFFIYIEIEETEDVGYLSNKYNGLKIVNIELEKEERKPKIHIRGYYDILGKLEGI